MVSGKFFALRANSNFCSRPIRFPATANNSNRFSIIHGDNILDRRMFSPSTSSPTGPTTTVSGFPESDVPSKLPMILKHESTNQSGPATEGFGKKTDETSATSSQRSVSLPALGEQQALVVYQKNSEDHSQKNPLDSVTRLAEAYQTKVLGASSSSASSQPTSSKIVEIQEKRSILEDNKENTHLGNLPGTSETPSSSECAILQPVPPAEQIDFSKLLMLADVTMSLETSWSSLSSDDTLSSWRSAMKPLPSTAPQVNPSDTEVVVQSPSNGSPKDLDVPSKLPMVFKHEYQKLTKSTGQSAATTEIGKKTIGTVSLSLETSSSSLTRNDTPSSSRSEMLQPLPSAELQVNPSDTEAAAQPAPKSAKGKRRFDDDKSSVSLKKAKKPHASLSLETSSSSRSEMLQRLRSAKRQVDPSAREVTVQPALKGSPKESVNGKRKIGENTTSVPPKKAKKPRYICPVCRKSSAHYSISCNQEGCEVWTHPGCANIRVKEYVKGSYRCVLHNDH